MHVIFPPFILKNVFSSFFASAIFIYCTCHFWNQKNSNRFLFSKFIHNAMGIYFSFTIISTFFFCCLYRGLKRLLMNSLYFPNILHSYWIWYGSNRFTSLIRKLISLRNSIFSFFKYAPYILINRIVFLSVPDQMGKRVCLCMS